MSAGNDVLSARLHVVDFYDTAAELGERAGGHLAAALVEGAAAAIVATPEHLEAICEVLSQQGVDLERERAARRLITVDASETLRALSVDGRPDASRCNEVIGGLLGSAASAGRPVAVYGEMVQLLWERGDVTGAIELETLWNGLGSHYDFTLYCAYRNASVANDAAGCADVCRLHDAVVCGEGPLPSIDRAFFEFPALLAAPSAARHFTLEVLEGWKMESLRVEASLVVTELATNAVCHAGCAFSVELLRTPSGLRISVRDASAAPPIRCVAEPTASSGRGLALIAGLSSEWGYLLQGAGKEVWALLRG
jgi:anti-sigma regulatory factor (Ser/Thr protein kinase)